MWCSNSDEYANIIETKWYVEYQERVPGVYCDWNLCNMQVVDFSKSSYKSFRTEKKALESYNNFIMQTTGYMPQVNKDVKSANEDAGTKKPAISVKNGLVVVVVVMLVAFVWKMYVV